MQNIRNLFSEFFGTFVLVSAGCGAVIADSLYGNPLGHPGIAAVFGIAVMIMIYSVGDVSGAHLNPAVTFGFFICGAVDLKQTVSYILAQTGGAVTASLFLNYIFPANSVNSGMTLPAVAYNKAFIIEVVITCILMFVISQVATGSKEKGVMAGVAIGSTVALCALVFGPVTGASMNPARSLGPAVAEMNFEAIWIYLTAPFVGSYLALTLLRVFRLDCCCSKNGCKS